jgi:hypothetical protein
MLGFEATLGHPGFSGVPQELGSSFRFHETMHR